MAASKFDTLHLHLTDSQSFPLLLEDTPELPLSQLALRGSFSPEKIYTKKDLRELVHFANGYGIEIIPEIDTPAHALSWGGAFQDLIVRCENVAGATQTPHNIYPLDPSHPRVYEIIRAILAQVVDIFPSKYLHVGGDEVEDRCWAESANLTHWARSNNLTVHGITGYFEQRVIDIVYDLRKIPIVWQGIIDSRSMPPIPAVRNNTAQSAPRALREALGDGIYSNSTTTPAAKSRLTDATGRAGAAAGSQLNVSDSSPPPPPPLLEEPAVVQPWKCWGGLALRAAMTALHSGHPMVMSACWYLDYNQDWTSYLATDLAASARASVAQQSAHAGGGGRGGSPNFRHNGRRAANAAPLQSAANNITDAHVNDTNTLTEEILSHLSAAQRMYLQLTDYTEEQAAEVPLSPSSSSSTRATPTTPSALHSNYFIPGGEASMWTEKVDCTNLECRLWPRAGAVGARLWGLGATFESVSYYNTGDGSEEHGGVTAAGRPVHSGGKLVLCCTGCYFFVLFTNVRLNKLPVSTGSCVLSCFVCQTGNRRHAQTRVGSQRTSSRHRTQPTTQTMKLDLPQTVQLYSAYVQYRYYLHDTLGMSPAPLVFHYPLRCNGESALSDTPETPQQMALCRATSKRKTANMIYPEDIPSAWLAFK